MGLYVVGAPLRYPAALLRGSSLKNGHIKMKSLFGFSSGGIDSTSSSIKSYAYQVDKLSFELDNGELELGSVPVTVTFDKRLIRPLFGRDLMSLLNVKINYNSA